MLMFWFSAYPEDKYQELVNAAQDAGYTLAKLPGGDNLCVLAESWEQVAPLYLTLQRIAPGIKYHKPT
jgi:hypothetical protein